MYHEVLADKAGVRLDSAEIDSNMTLELAVFNRSLALDRVGGDEDLLREVAQLFLREYRPLLSQLCDAVQHADADRVMEAAHTMKGSLATLGAEAGAQAAFQLELMGRKHLLDGSTSVCRTLEEQLHLLDEELQRVAAGE